MILKHLAQVDADKSELQWATTETVKKFYRFLLYCWSLETAFSSSAQARFLQ